MLKLFIIISLLALGVTKCICQVTPIKDNKGNIEQVFEEKYSAWKKWVAAHLNSNDGTNCPEYVALTKLGPEVVPVIIKKIQTDKNGSSGLAEVIGAITKVRITQDKWPPQATYGDVFLLWWNVYRKQTAETYATLKKKWHELLVSDTIERSYNRLPRLWENEMVYDYQTAALMEIPRQRLTELGKTYFAIKDLGIDVLPLIVADVKKGDSELLPIFFDLTQYKMGDSFTPAKTRMESALKWWELHNDEWTIPEK